MLKIELTGKVFTGQGEGRIYVERPWVKHEVEEKLGFTPYAGTLNLRLSAESETQRKTLEKSALLKVCAAEGCCSGKIFKAQIDTLECAVVIPEVDGYPRDVLEIIAWTNLRERLGLRDGDDVKVRVTV